MGESTSQIERDIAAERKELGRNLQLLENKARSLADWRTYYRNHPFAMMALALGGGALLGALTNGVGVSRREQYRGEGLISDDDTRYSGPSALSSSTANLRRQFGDTWDHIADALIGVAAAKAIEYVSELVPGFREQFAEKHPEHRAAFSSRSRDA
jgi:hypothetical protein